MGGWTMSLTVRNHHEHGGGASTLRHLCVIRACSHTHTHTHTRGPPPPASTWLVEDESSGMLERGALPVAGSLLRGRVHWDKSRGGQEVVKDRKL